MKKSELRLMIRKIVREEVAMSIQEVITELKQPTNQITEQKVSKPIPKRQIRKEKQSFSSNSIINDVLNETAEAADEWASLGGGTFDSGRMNEVMARQYGDMGTKESSQAHLAASLGADPSSPPDFLTKDYSQLLKKVDEKAKQTRG